VIGETGNGKSQLCQYLTNDDKSTFHPSKGIDSFTTQVSDKRVTVNNFDIQVFDTPGLNDQKGDSEHIEEMVTKLRGVSDCKAILIVMNPHQPRFTGSTQKIVEYFRDIFGSDIISIVALVWTRSSKHLAEYWRKEKEQEYVGKVKELFTQSVAGHIPSFYVNSAPYDHLYEYDPEFHPEEVKKLLTWANSNQYKDCSSIKVVSTKESKESGTDWESIIKKAIPMAAEVAEKVIIPLLTPSPTVSHDYTALRPVPQQRTSSAAFPTVQRAPAQVRTSVQPPVARVPVGSRVSISSRGPIGSLH